MSVCTNLASSTRYACCYRCSCERSLRRLSRTHPLRLPRQTATTKCWQGRHQDHQSVLWLRLMSEQDSMSTTNHEIRMSACTLRCCHPVPPSSLVHIPGNYMSTSSWHRNGNLTGRHRRLFRHPCRCLLFCMESPHRMLALLEQRSLCAQQPLCPMRRKNHYTPTTRQRCPPRR